VSYEPVKLKLQRDGDAFIIEHTGDLVALLATSPAPPGSTVEATYPGGSRSVAVRVKVRGCRRADLPDGRQGFRIEGRFVSLTRADREVLFESHGETDPRSRFET